MLLNKLLSLSNLNKHFIMLITDASLLIISIFFSFYIRLGEIHIPSGNLLFLATLAVPIISIPIFAFFEVYRSVIRYINSNAIWHIVKAVSLYALVWGFLALFFASEELPRSVIVINWILSISVIVFIRVLIRIILLDNIKFNIMYSRLELKKKVLIYGAGDAGRQLASALTHSHKHLLIGFIDDAKNIQGKRILGLKVFSFDELFTNNNQIKIDEILVTMPSISRERRAEIIESLESHSIIVRTLPGVNDLADGKVHIDDLRIVEIDDLLGRNKVQPNHALLSKNITNKTVVVTGAGGSIGSELCRQIQSLNPNHLILLESSELSLYLIDKELNNNQSLVDIIPVLCNITDKKHLNHIFQIYTVDTIYHAAAYKHVPMVEFNSTIAINNNIFGTLNCAQVAIENNVKSFVLISTDKAVRPTSTMGATKRYAELILQSLDKKQEVTNFSMVRFGNVMDSSGSVIPLFKEQIKKGGPLTVTDKEMTRFFMSIPEAVELVIQAGAMAEGGEVFVLDMGEPIKIDFLARKMINLSGLTIRSADNIDGDIEIQYSGLRPGEKLYEELFINEEPQATTHQSIMKTKETMYPWHELEPMLQAMRIANDVYDFENVRDLLTQAVPEFNPQCDIKDLLYK